MLLYTFSAIKMKENSQIVKIKSQIVKIKSQIVKIKSQIVKIKQASNRNNLNKKNLQRKEKND